MTTTAPAFKAECISQYGFDDALYFCEEKQIFCAYINRDSVDAFCKNNLPSKIQNGDCLYLLLADEHPSERRQVYVGETKDFVRRIKDHQRKVFWTSCFVMTCTNFESWGGERARYHVEARLIDLLRKNQKCILMNYQGENDLKHSEQYHLQSVDY